MRRIDLQGREQRLNGPRCIVLTATRLRTDDTNQLPHQSNAIMQYKTITSTRKVNEPYLYSYLEINFVDWTRSTNLFTPTSAWLHREHPLLSLRTI